MFGNRILLISVLTVACGTVASAADVPIETPVAAKKPAKIGILDLIPADACGAFAIRNLAELKKKGDRFVEETKIVTPLRPTELFAMAYQWLGITKGLDEDAAAAVMILTYKNVGQNIVMAVPFTNRDDMASNFGLKGADLQPGKVVMRKKIGDNRRRGWGYATHLMVRGKHIFLGRNESALSRATKWKPLRSELSESQQALLDSSDVLFHVSTKGLGKAWEDWLQAAERRVDAKPDSPEARIWRQLGPAIRNLKIGLMAVRIDRGLGFNLVSLFKKDEATAKILNKVAGGPGAADVKGLPAGNLLVALGARGDGLQNGDLARALSEMLLNHSSTLKQFVSAAQRHHFVGVFTEVWKRLKGSRTALYQNTDAKTHGMFSLVAILDTEDPKKFLAEMRDLGMFINSAGLKLTDGKEEGIDETTVKKLIEDLGDVSFRVRETATVKLGLLGDAALPYLETATKSKDLEVATRARRLKTRILAVAADRRKNLLQTDLLSRVKPKFAYFDKAETRGGKPIDIVNVRLSDKDAQIVPQLRQLLGPDWDKIRIATHGKQVVALFGSNTTLLETTLTNLKSNAPGLAADPALAEFSRRRAAARKVEIHLSLARIMALVAVPKAGQKAEMPANALSSFALTIGPDRIQLDAFIPYAEIKAMVKSQVWR